MLIDRENVAAVRREEKGEGDLSYVLNYNLIGETTRAGNSFYYMTAHLEVWREGNFIGEDLELAGGLGCDRNRAFRVFERISNSSSPVFPVHLGEVMSDVILNESRQQPLVLY